MAGEVPSAGDPAIDALAEEVRDRLQLSQAQRLAIRKAVAEKQATVGEDTVYSWESQANQYPLMGPPGATAFQLPPARDRQVNCVLFRGEGGDLLGILNHYPVDLPPLEQKYTLNVWVHPDRRGEGIATRLVLAAMQQGWPISVEDVRATGPGLALTRSVARRLRKDVATAPLVRVSPVESDGTLVEDGGRDALAVRVRAGLQMSDEEVDAARRELASKTVSVSEDRMLTWESQARQYPELGPQGVSSHVAELPTGAKVNCLLLRRPDGRLVGILNHYAEAIGPLQKANTMNIWVHPDHRRQGIGSELVLSALQRDWPVDLEEVAFTGAGEAMARSLIQRVDPRPDRAGRD
ncbi:MAG TPA: GNAT family N-acetyltransferase [Acidimicrobiales bacterium]|jgi:GNAT superfamily N-acetyltransferase|nr:GNAT family N-acetyltransferase [Acidimicrobiales bacterium]